MNDNEKNKNSLSIELPKEVAGGNYSNLALITHSGSEFILDFARLLPGIPKATVCTRVIMTPEHAKRLMIALNDNISKFEKQFGEIKLNGSTPANTIPMGFNPNAEA